MDFETLKRQAHLTAIKHGFWDDILSDEHYMMLIVTEVAEAVNADRCGKMAKREEMEPPLIDGRFDAIFEAAIKDTVEDELADVVIRLLDLAGAKQVSLSAIAESHKAEVMKARTFTENAFDLVQTLTCGSAVDWKIQSALDYVQAWAAALGVDLQWHVEAKMRYNENRPLKHSKKY